MNLVMRTSNDGVGGGVELGFSPLHFGLLAIELLVQLRRMQEDVREVLRHLAGLGFPRLAAVGGNPVASAVVGGVGRMACCDRLGR